MIQNAKQLAVRLLILLLALGALFLLSGNRVEAGEPVVFTEYVVTVGDTLWEIAATVTPAGESTRSTVYELRELNRLESSDLRPGQVLLLPER